MSPRRVFTDSSHLTTFVARELWRQKAWWPVSWDQSALAESVLELIGCGEVEFSSRAMQVLIMALLD